MRARIVEVGKRLKPTRSGCWARHLRPSGKRMVWKGCRTLLGKALGEDDEVACCRDRNEAMGILWDGD